MKPRLKDWGSSIIDFCNFEPSYDHMRGKNNLKVMKDIVKSTGLLDGDINESVSYYVMLDQEYEKSSLYIRLDQNISEILKGKSDEEILSNIRTRLGHKILRMPKNSTSNKQEPKQRNSMGNRYYGKMKKLYYRLQK